MAKEKKKAKKSSKPEVKEIPEFFDGEGQLKTLRTANFPKSKAGRMAYCDYQVEKWKIKKIAVEKKMDPLAKKKKKREKLQEQLKKLDEELLAEETEEKKS